MHLTQSAKRRSSLPSVSEVYKACSISSLLLLARLELEPSGNYCVLVFHRLLLTVCLSFSLPTPSLSFFFSLFCSPLYSLSLSLNAYSSPYHWKSTLWNAHFVHISKYTHLQIKGPFRMHLEQPHSESFSIRGVLQVYADVPLHWHFKLRHFKWGHFEIVRIWQWSSFMLSHLTSWVGDKYISLMSHWEYITTAIKWTIESLPPTPSPISTTTVPHHTLSSNPPHLIRDAVWILNRSLTMNGLTIVLCEDDE